jgi:hypothetical protein
VNFIICMVSVLRLTPLKRVISYGNAKDPELKDYEQTKDLSGDERVSHLEELKLSLSAVTGDDYSQRLGITISYSQRKPR